MNDKNQKVLRDVVITVLAIAFVVFVILYLTGRVGDISGFTSETPESISESSAEVIAPTASQSAVVSTETSTTVESSTPTVESSAPVSEISSVTSSSSSPTVISSTPEPVSSEPTIQQTSYKFRNKNLLDQHYEKHGREMGFASAEEYEKAAAAVPNHPDVLHKIEKEDGDDVYYIEATNEFVIVSTDGYIRTYFNPDRGIDYYNKQ